MNYKGIIFDFNGTLFQDTPLHLAAWEIYSEKLRGYPFTYDEMIHHMLGRPNDLIVEYCIGKKPDKEFAQKCAIEKEAIYRKMCLEKKDFMHLTKGAPEFLTRLKNESFPMTIATGSEKTNVDFFIEQFNLGQWFDLDKIVYDDGTIKGKPYPDAYIKAAQNIDIAPKDCLVFEDALAGVKASVTAGIGHTVVIASKEHATRFKNIDGIDLIVEDFSTF